MKNISILLKVVLVATPYNKQCSANITLHDDFRDQFFNMIDNHLYKIGVTESHIHDNQSTVICFAISRFVNLNKDILSWNIMVILDNTSLIDAK